MTVQYTCSSTFSDVEDNTGVSFSTFSPFCQVTPLAFYQLKAEAELDKSITCFIKNLLFFNFVGEQNVTPAHPSEKMLIFVISATATFVTNSLLR